MISRKVFLKSATALVALSMAVPTVAFADGHTRVVATFSILGDMVARVGGDHIDLTTIVGPDGDAHVYQPTPQDAKAVSQADVLIVNGLEFEGWLERLTEASGFDGQLVVATTGIDAIPFEEGGDHDDHDDHDDHADHDDHDDHADHDDHDDHADHDGHDDHADHNDHDDHAGHDDHDDHADHDDHEDHADHDDHDDHAGHDDHHHGAFDPHAWQSLDHAVVYVGNIVDALAAADADHANLYQANGAAYIAELEALDAEIDAMMASIPEDQRTVVTAHDAFGYLAQAYDMTFLAPVGFSTESEASAFDVAALIEQIREEGINAVFVEAITDSRLLEQIANETGVSIGGTLYTGALSQEDGPAATYIEMMRHNAKTLSSALGGS